MSEQSTNKESALAVIEARIRNKDFGGALTLIYDDLANDTADPGELMYLQAVCQRYLGRFEDALTTLEQLKHRTPNNGRAHQEEGHNRRELEDKQGAILAYNRATQLNPALTASWQQLHRL